MMQYVLYNTYGILYIDFIPFIVVCTIWHCTMTNKLFMIRIYERGIYITIWIFTFKKKKKTWKLYYIIAKVYLFYFILYIRRTIVKWIQSWKVRSKINGKKWIRKNIYWLGLNYLVTNSLS